MLRSLAVYALLWAAGRLLALAEWLHGPPLPASVVEYLEGL